jgi:hypothetical protein
MAEKLWWLDVSAKIDAYVQDKNQNMREGLNLKHSRSDIKFFTFSKAVYLEEDVFKYFYPFCLVNCSIGAAIVFKQNSYPAIILASVAMLEYVYFLFAFPVESWHFHKRALSTSLPYAQYLRETYIERFPDSYKAA